MDSISPALIVAIVFALFVVIIVARSVRIIPQAHAGIIERLGRYNRTLDPGLHVLVPFIDTLKPLVDLREQVVTFPPQPVITQDNVTISIDTVLYFQVTDPFARDLRGRRPDPRGRAADDHHAAQRDRLAHARGGADQPRQDQRRPAHRARRGHRALGHPRQPHRAQVDRSAGLHPGGDGEADARRARQARRDPLRPRARSRPPSSPPRASGRRRSCAPRPTRSRRSCARRATSRPPILRATGEAEAIRQLFQSIHAGDPTPDLLAYKYLEALPKLAEGQSDEADDDPERRHAGARRRRGHGQRLPARAGRRGRAGDDQRRRRPTATATALPPARRRRELDPVTAGAIAPSGPRAEGVRWDLSRIVEDADAARALLDDSLEACDAFAERYRGRVGELDGPGLAAALDELAAHLQRPRPRRLVRRPAPRRRRQRRRGARPRGGGGAGLGARQQRAALLRARLDLARGRHRPAAARRAGGGARPPPPADDAPLPAAPAAGGRGADAGGAQPGRLVGVAEPVRADRRQRARALRRRGGPARPHGRRAARLRPPPGAPAAAGRAADALRGARAVDADPGALLRQPRRRPAGRWTACATTRTRWRRATSTTSSSRRRSRR